MTIVNKWRTVDDLPFDDRQKEIALEWLAWKLWKIETEGIHNDDCYYGKSYDPLTIEGNTAHSYVFDMEDGGRHHPFKNLAHLEDMMINEIINEIRYTQEEK